MDRAEKIAREIANQFSTGWAEQHRAQFEAALASALRSHVPEGWKLVPEEPTIAMERAAWESKDGYRSALSSAAEYGRSSSIHALYRAMLEAAPAPPSQEDGK